MTLYDEIETELDRAAGALWQLQARITPDTELDDVACDDIDAGLDDISKALQALREAVGSRRVVLHEGQL